MRGLRRDDRSVSGYRETLDVLSRLGAAARPADERRDGKGAEDAAGRLDRPAHEDGPERPPGRDRQVGLAGQALADRPSLRLEGLEADAGVTQTRRAVRALGVMDRDRRRSLWPAVLTVAGLVVAGGIAYGVATRSHPHSAPPVHHHTPPPTTSTTTTLPASYAPVGSGPSAATYAPVTGSYALKLAATSGPCWMSVTNAAGTTVFAQTLSAGTSTTVPLSGNATVVLGAPTSAALAAGGVPLTLPSGIVGPFTVTLAPK